jgi:hypothetical protein
MTNPFEDNLIERARWNTLSDSTTRAAWRRVTEAMTGSLPTWAQRSTSGRKCSFDVAEAVALYRLGASTLQAVADNYGVTPQTIGYHVRKAEAAVREAA